MMLRWLVVLVFTALLGCDSTEAPVPAGFAGLAARRRVSAQ